MGDDTTLMSYLNVCPLLWPSVSNIQRADSSLASHPSLSLSLCGSVSAWLYRCRCLLSFFFSPPKKHDMTVMVMMKLNSLLLLSPCFKTPSVRRASDEVKGAMDHAFLTDHSPSMTAGCWTESDRCLCCRQKNEPL